jgi:molybdopterin synthase catalytic subunit
MDIRVQEDAFDLGAEANAFAARQKGMGAVVTFTGVVRDLGEGDLQAMQIEHYPGMTEKAISKIADEALSRWNLGDILVVHRHGVLRAEDLIMMVATSSRHRVDAFQKSRAPFWKKEVTPEGADWVDAKDEDEDALSRW